MKNFLDNDELKNLPFDVPDNYFEDFTDKLMDKIENVNKRNNKNTDIFRKIIVSVTAAAAVIILGLLVSLFVTMPESDTTVHINESEIIQELEYFQIEDQFIAELTFEDTEINQANTVNKIENSDENSTDLTDDEIIEYLLDEGINITQIAELY